jgi:flagellar hook-associated protein 1 FlgK
MGTSALSIGVSGLNAAQAGLRTAGHNIANANTPGFSRQQIVQSTNPPMFTGAGFFGQGTNVATVQRVYNQFLAAQVATANTGVAEMDTYAQQIAQLDNLLADPNAGLSPALQEYFRAVSEVSASPSSTPARQAMLASGQALAGRFQSLDQRMSEMRDGVNAQIGGTVGQVNSLAQQVAELNDRITVAVAVGPNFPPNDLLDQRDQLLADLNKLVRVTTAAVGDGSVSVFIGNGQALVIGTQVSKLTVAQSLDDASRLEVGMVAPNGTAVPLQETLLTGGRLGGLIAFRSETLDPAQNALGRIAIGFVESFNDQHRLGQDLTGALGGDLFAAGQPQVLTSPRNTGTAAVSVTLGNIADLTDSDYRLTYEGTSTTFTLVRVNDGTIWSGTGASQAAAFSDLTTKLAADPQGFVLGISGGAAATGDSYLIQPTRTGAREIAQLVADPRSIAAAAPIRSGASGANTGTASIGSAAVLPPAPPNANLRQPVSIVFDNPPTTFSVTGTGTGNPTGVAFTPGATISFNGWSVQISGQPAAGDAFSVGPNSNGVADNRNALALGSLQTRNLLVGGTSTYQSTYSQLVSGIGNKAHEVEVRLSAQETLAKQATDAMQSVSGVNLDEEAANLLRYQQAFQAAARMIEVSGRLFDELLSLGR